MITASLTTIPDRTKALKETVKSLLPQVDKLNVYLHGYKEMPQFLKNEKIEVAFDLEHGDRGDIDKMAWCDEVKGYHLICDDDLIYPPNYAKKMVKAINQYNKKALVSFHGSILKRLPIARYYQDRIVFPCLGTVVENQEVSIIGTGTLGYHSTVGMDKIDLKDKFPNMLDIHVSIWAKEKKIKTYVIAHEEGWIQHSKNVDLNKTIFAIHQHNDYIHTSMLNGRADLFNSPQRMVKGMPIVSIVVVNSRGRKSPHMLQECYESIREQTYPNIEPVVVENTDRLMTIGKAFNDAAQLAKGEWVLYLGDDDKITPDYVQSLMTFAYGRTRNGMVGVSSFLTMFTGVNGTMNAEPRDLIPTGMWKRKYLLEHPFAEYLTKYVDTDLMRRTEEEGFKQGLMRWHYGYFYRSHQDQVSGHKALVLQDKYASWRTDEVKDKLKELAK